MLLPCNPPPPRPPANPLWSHLRKGTHKFRSIHCAVLPTAMWGRIKTRRVASRGDEFNLRSATKRRAPSRNEEPLDRGAGLTIRVISSHRVNEWPVSKTCQPREGVAQERSASCLCRPANIELQDSCVRLCKIWHFRLGLTVSVSFDAKLTSPGVEPKLDLGCIWSCARHVPKLRNWTPKLATETLKLKKLHQQSLGPRVSS